jgi:antitoxin component YwqK of YwqJK toxin-antitoxin module
MRYVDDLMNGYAIEYFSKDKLLFEGTFEKGELKGKGVEYKYYDNGNIKSKEELNGEEYDGVVNEYFENGNLKITSSYVNDYRVGVFKLYFENGNLQVIGEYSNDKKTGTWKEYYKNGEFKEIENFNNGDKSGEAKYYWSDAGKYYLGSKGSFSKDKKTGVWYTYEKNGDIRSKITYENGYKEKIIHATKLFFENKTRSVASILLRYRNVENEWETEGWFNIEPGDKVYLRKVLDTKYLFYGEIKNAKWKGDERRKFKGKYYPMVIRNIPENTMKYNQGSFTQVLQ